MQFKNEFESQMYRLLPQRTPTLRVLEAGCGSLSRLRLDPSWHITGIDLSERQLARNTDLHERVLGDLEEYRWDNSAFDLVICWDVIEHLPNPQKALSNLFGALAPEGLLVLAFPNLHSIKGWVTKLTPYRVHVFFYRFVMGYESSVAEEHQFPTYLRREIKPGHIVELAQRHGLETCFRLEYEGSVQTELRQSNKLANGFFKLISPLGLNDSDAMLMLRKTA
jgi:2-polyprenyl-3-methyl-5-hydroxy-6-metoxy-1,4-benzoquinol methylase